MDLWQGGKAPLSKAAAHNAFIALARHARPQAAVSHSLVMLNRGHSLQTFDNVTASD